MWDFPGQLLVDHLLEDLERLRPHKRQPVDKERGSRADAQIDREIAVRLNGILEASQAVDTGDKNVLHAARL